MAFTAYFCNNDSPWIGGNGVIAVAWYQPDNGLFNVSITGVLAAGGAYSFSVNVTVDTTGPGNTFGYGKAIKAGTYTVVVTEASTSLTQSYNFTINDYPEDFVVNCNVVQPTCSQTLGYVEFSYNTGQFNTMQYCVHSSSVIPFPPTNCNCGNGKFPISKGQITTSCLLPPGTYDVYLENNTVSCQFSIPGVSYGAGGAGNSGFCRFTINQPTNAPLSISVSSVDTICDTLTGSITIDSINGVGPYTYSWTGPGGFTSSSADITNLDAGDYTLVVTDSSGCTGTITVSIATLPDANGCLGPVLCYKAVNCNPDCFGSSVYYLTGADISPLFGYIVNGLDIDGEAINPTDCWIIQETDPAESNPGFLPCYIDYNIGTQSILINCSVTINGVNVYTGPTTQTNTASFVAAIVTPGAITGGFTVNAGSTPISFDICAPDVSYSGDDIIVEYQYYDNIIKNYIPVQITYNFDIGVPATGCYAAVNFLGYNTLFSSCELCAPPVCPEEPPFVKIIPDPVKIYYEIRESNCDITATKQFATAYSNMLKKIKYGIADCCNGLNIAETWVNKQISNLQATIIPGYNCRNVIIDGCNWLPLEGCEILSNPSEGTSILARTGEAIVYAKLVMLQNNGLIYLNQPLVEANYQRAIGFTTMDVVMGATTRVLVNGMITNPAWSLITGAIYFAAPDGNITTAVPTVGISQMVGIAVNATTLFVDIKQPNILC